MRTSPKWPPSKKKVYRNLNFNLPHLNLKGKIKQKKSRTDIDSLKNAIKPLLEIFLKKNLLVTAIKIIVKHVWLNLCSNLRRKIRRI
jgi:hypothetical protein